MGQLIKGTNIEKNSLTLFACLCNELMIIGMRMRLATMRWGMDISAHYKTPAGSDKKTACCFRQLLVGYVVGS